MQRLGNPISKASRGFTLIELMVVVVILGILAAIVITNISGSSAKGRDAKRQSDLRQLEAAITQYKQQFGRYPVMGADTDGDGFASEDESGDYIVGLASAFISKLPKDPNRDSNPGYSYATNANGTVFKIMSINTVESQIVNYSHPFKSCDVRPNTAGNIQVCSGGINCSMINQVGWCVYVATAPLSGGEPDRCKMTRDGGNGRFDNSFGLWGGYADSGSTTPPTVRFTTDVICR